MHDARIEAKRVMRMYGWRSMTFALEYVMAREVHGLGHVGAINEAKRSPFVKPYDIPNGV
jgi:hypothetical protein